MRYRNRVTSSTPETLLPAPLPLLLAAILGAPTIAHARPVSINLADLNGSNGFAINGVDTDDVSGRSVAGAGDINGDGLADVIIGAINGDPGGRADAGESYVVFGTRDVLSPAELSLSDLDGSNGFVINGIDADDRAGISVSGASDINGDGWDDLLIGAFFADPNGKSRAGESYVVFGGNGVGSNGAIDLAALDGYDGFVINGISTDDLSGRAVSGAGDVNGDGISDLIIGADNINPSSTKHAGRSYVVFGGAGIGSTATMNLSALDGSNGFVINGIDAYDRSGRAVSDAGDINGDGFSDLIIGAYLAAPNGSRAAGESYVVFGGNGVGSSGALDLAELDGNNGFVINGTNVNDRSGYSVSGAGDVNGDGSDDLIIGAERASQNGIKRSGKSYVVFGGNGVGSSGAIELANLGGSDGFVINGINEHDYSGKAVSGAGDVNNDGIADMIIGASHADPNGQNESGQSYVLFGDLSIGSNGTVNLSTIDGNNGFVINGRDASGYSGFSVADAGDFNGDGIDDLIIGAFHASPNNSSLAGASYLVFGSAGLPAEPDSDATLVTSCLAGNGRVDLNLVNGTTATSTYRFELQGQSPRQSTVVFEDWGRMPITGRPAGDYEVIVKRDGITIIDTSLSFNCNDPSPTISSPEVSIVNACRNGNGYVLFQMANPTSSSRPYVIEFDGVPNRSTTAAAYGQAVRATTGRPNGSYSYRVRTGSTVLDSGSVVVDCE